MQEAQSLRKKGVRYAKRRWNRAAPRKRGGSRKRHGSRTRRSTRSRSGSDGPGGSRDGPSRGMYLSEMRGHGSPSGASPLQHSDMPNLRDPDGAQMIKGHGEGTSRTADRKNEPPKENGAYVFGPVPSRRLGKSLGIDLVPLKTCTYDCIYCQLGRTTNRTICRKPYVSGKAVVRQLEGKLSSLSEKPDYITFSGSGEPTLNSELGWVIEQISGLTKIPIAVLTNGSLLHLESVRRALREVDLVIPSLDAGNAQLYRMINRPHPSLNFSQVLRGLEEFRKEFGGSIWLEVMLCGGINDERKEISRIRDLIGKIGPDRVQLNTVYRPPAEDFAFPLPPSGSK